MRHIALSCPPCPKQCRAWPMFVASVDLFLPQSQGSIHQCCHDPILGTGGRTHQPMDIKHQLYQFARDHDGGVHSIYRVADRVFAAAGAEAGKKKRRDAGMAFERPVNFAELLLSDRLSPTISTRHPAACLHRILTNIHV